jgi:hypothetical protein
MILDVKMKAAAPSSGLLQDVENGFHAATSASSAALTVSTLSRRRPKPPGRAMMADSR